MPQVNLEQCSQHVLIDKSPYSTVPGAKYGSFVNFCSSGIVFSTIVPQSNLQTIGHGFTTACVLVLCNLIKKSKVPTQLSITSPVVTLYFVCSSLPGITITISIGQSRAESRSADMLTVLQYFSQPPTELLSSATRGRATTHDYDEVRETKWQRHNIPLSFSLGALADPLQQECTTCLLDSMLMGYHYGLRAP